MTTPSPAPAAAARPGRTVTTPSAAARDLSMRTAAAPATRAKAAVSAACGTRAASAPPSIAGPIPAAVNSSPVRHRTCPSRACATGAVTEVTMTRLAVVAPTGLNPSR